MSPNTTRGWRRRVKRHDITWIQDIVKPDLCASRYDYFVSLYFTLCFDAKQSLEFAKYSLRSLKMFPQGIFTRIKKNRIF